MSRQGFKIALAGVICGLPCLFSAIGQARTAAACIKSINNGQMEQGQALLPRGLGEGDEGAAGGLPEIAVERGRGQGDRPDRLGVVGVADLQPKPPGDEVAAAEPAAPSEPATPSEPAAPADPEREVDGILTVYPGTGAAPPNTSTLSYRANMTRANNSVMRLSSSGRPGRDCAPWMKAFPRR